MKSQLQDSELNWYPHSKSDSYPDSISFPDSYTYWSWSWYWYSDSDSYSNSDLYLYSNSDSGLNTEQAVEGEPTPSSSQVPGMSTGNFDEEVSTSTEGPHQPDRTGALTVALPTVAVIFLLLLLVCFILLWKKTRKSKRSESSSNAMNQGLGRGEEVEQLKNQTPVVMSATSWNHYKQPRSDGERREDTHYAEVDETSQPIAKGISPRNRTVSPSVSYEDNAQIGHEHEEANIPGTQMNNGYEKTNSEDPQSSQRYEKESNRGEQKDTEYKTDLVTGPLYQTLNPTTPSSGSSFAPLSSGKQDGGYDSLDRQKNQKQAELKTDSGYDETKRIGKGDAKVEFGIQINNDYLALSRSSANTSDYDKLGETRRSYESEKISPNDYNVLHPQEKN